MTQRTVTLDELKGHTVEDVLKELVSRQEVLTVRLPEGAAVTVEPSPRLKPLPRLKGQVPEGWKNAIYR